MIFDKIKEFLQTIYEFPLYFHSIYYSKILNLNTVKWINIVYIFLWSIDFNDDNSNAKRSAVLINNLIIDWNNIVWRLNYRHLISSIGSHHIDWF